MNDYAASVEKLIGLQTITNGNIINLHISSAMFLLKLSAAGWYECNLFSKAIISGSFRWLLWTLVALLHINCRYYIYVFYICAAIHWKESMHCKCQQRIAEWLSLEGTSRHHLIQPTCPNHSYGSLLTAASPNWLSFRSLAKPTLLLSWHLHPWKQVEKKKSCWHCIMEFLSNIPIKFIKIYM